jgi:hypothetical protein
MQRALGIDLADDLARWAVVGPTRVLASGRRTSTVEIDGVEVDQVVARLGLAEPIMVAGVPYGAEALVGRLLAGIVDEARAAHGDVGVALVHDDELDEYRRSLLVEAARVGEIGPVTLVERSTAAGAVPPAAAGGGSGDDDDHAAGAAFWLLAQADEPGGALGTAAALGGGTAVGLAAGAAVVASGGGSPATAAAPAAAGPTGTPLTPTTGPTGTPLTPTAGPIGPTGTPLTPTAGPTGTPLTPAIGAAGKAFPIGAIAAAGAAIVAVVAVVAVVVTRGGNEPIVRPADSVVAAEPSAAPGSPDGGTAASPTTAAAATPTTSGQPGTTGDTPDTTATAPVVDVSAFTGGWEGECDPFIDGSGGASGTRYELTQTGPGTLEFVILAMLYTGGCGTPGVEEGRITFTLVAVGESTVAGVPVVEFDGSEGTTDIGLLPPGFLAARPWFVGIDGAQLRVSEDGVSFIPGTGARG